MVLYPEQIILDAEIAMNVYDTYKTFEFSDFDETLAVIKAVGPRGHYLRQKHTRTHMRDFHYSPIFHQQDTNGALRDPRDMAMEGFQKIYDSHQPEPLPDNALKEMDQILAVADKTAKKLAS
jgi:trimethylamine--corrinoid protein Co-methyltransferase